VAEILSQARSLKVPEELEELTAGLLSLRARRLAPVVSDEETRLLLTINAGVSAELTHRAKALIEKRDDCGLTSDESSELLELADEVERRGIERLEALSRLAELRGVSLRELMQSLGVTAGDQGQGESRDRDPRASARARPGLLRILSDRGSFDRA
jgi:hypothetical protein